MTSFEITMDPHITNFDAFLDAKSLRVEFLDRYSELNLKWINSGFDEYYEMLLLGLEKSFTVRLEQLLRRDLRMEMDIAGAKQELGTGDNLEHKDFFLLLKEQISEIDRDKGIAAVVKTENTNKKYLACLTILNTNGNEAEQIIKSIQVDSFSKSYFYKLLGVKSWYKASLKKYSGFLASKRIFIVQYIYLIRNLREQIYELRLNGGMRGNSNKQSTDSGEKIESRTTKIELPQPFKVNGKAHRFVTSFYFPIVVGFLGGWLIYYIIVRDAYSSLANTIVNTKVFDKIVERDPAFYALFNDENQRINLSLSKDAVIWRLLTDLGVIPTSKRVEDIMPGISKRLGGLIDNHPNQNIRDITFVQLLIETSDLNRSIKSSEDPNSNLRRYLADCLARKPQSLNILRNYNNNTDESEGEEKMGTQFQYFLPRSVSMKFWGGEVNPNLILSAIYEKNNFHTHFKDLPNVVDTSAKDDPYEDYRQVKDFHQRLVMSLNDVPEVLSAKNWVFYVEGPEQLAMFILTTVALLILMQRLFKAIALFGFSTISDDTSKMMHKWFRWITITMPLFGFIGTKRGLSEALSQSDSIIRAGTEINQAMTMSNITYSLGIAFTTTLVALILSLSLNFLDNIVKTYEGDFDVE